MFISSKAILDSIGALSEVHPFYGIPFLAFKKKHLPVGSAINVIFSKIVNDILFSYYKPLSNHSGFYSPFLTSDKNDRWQKERYASTTIQRITADTFGEAFIHQKGTQIWGWKTDYLKILKNKLLDNQKIPAFYLATWLFRQNIWPTDTGISDILNAFYKEFNISEEERNTLFDDNLPYKGDEWFQEDQVTNAEILNLIGYPNDNKVVSGAILESLEIVGIGPATRFVYQPSERLNIITGDNSLGKSFIYDCIWWALTNNWINDEPRPRNDVSRKSPSVKSQVQSFKNSEIRTQSVTLNYSWQKQKWDTNDKKFIEAGLAIYAQYDGSFSVWDSTINGSDIDDTKRQKILNLSKDEIWNGLADSKSKKSLCNGIIRDWVSWQQSGTKFEKEWNALKGCLKMLSPANEPLAAGEPSRVSIEDQREVPTIIMPYGSVFLVHASAGIQRIVALAYILVWTWFRHVGNSELSRQNPHSNLVLLVDEIELHLHPRWQKTIVPALMKAVESISQHISPQIHIATHSPLVMASTETIFDEEKDDFHHLRLDGREVILEEIPYHKQGTADNWLLSDAFDKTMPRSLEGGLAIKDAIEIQLHENPDNSKVIEINDRLRTHLDSMDEFWPRWRYFAKMHGVR